MTAPDPQVSHVDLYHKLGKVEGILETMMTSISSFQSAVKDIHARIDAIENRQTILEKRQSQDKGAANALTTAIKDFAIPVLAIAITWMVTRSTPENGVKLPPASANQHHLDYNGTLGGNR